MFVENFWLAFGLTAFAGLSTGIGSALAFFTKSTGTKFLSIALGFSGGVMIYVSFAEILKKSRDLLTLIHGEPLGNWLMVVSFFTGMILIALIDHFIPEYENPHEIHRVEEIDSKGKPLVNRSSLMRMGLFTALAIAIHNFPEGLATFAAGLADIQIAIPIAIAIAIHNIPEGIAVSIPIYYATGKRRKAFLLALLSGLVEPLGALIGYFLLYSIFNDTVMGFLLGEWPGSWYLYPLTNSFPLQGNTAIIIFLYMA